MLTREEAALLKVAPQQTTGSNCGITKEIKKTTEWFAKNKQKTLRQISMEVSAKTKREAKLARYVFKLSVSRSMGREIESFAKTEGLSLCQAVKKLCARGIESYKPCHQSTRFLEIGSNGNARFGWIGERRRELQTGQTIGTAILFVDGQGKVFVELTKEKDLYEEALGA